MSERLGSESPIPMKERRFRILVATEDPELRRLVVSTLSQFGFACAAAADCRSAMQILQAESPTTGTVLVGARNVAADPAAPTVPSDQAPVRLEAQLQSSVNVGVAEAADGTDFGLVICDVKMPDRDGIWLLDQVQEGFADISVIMLTAVNRGRAAVECLRRGATDYLVKPIDMDELLVAVDQAIERRRLLLENRAYQLQLERMVEERTRELQRTLARLHGSYSETMAALATALDAREQETAHHSERVARGCVRLLRRLGVEEDPSLDAIEMGAMLHDIGKIGIPDSILLKPGPLDDREWEVMRQHPVIGYEILKEIQFLEPSLELVLYHQEKFDGSGYPYGLASSEIPLAARAFSVVDAWDAMTNLRPYRQPMPNSQAMIELLRCAGSHFDPVAIDTFFEIVREDGGLPL